MGKYDILILWFLGGIVIAAKQYIRKDIGKRDRDHRHFKRE
jgi:hypothetical protein